MHSGSYSLSLQEGLCVKSGWGEATKTTTPVMQGARARVPDWNLNPPTQLEWKKESPWVGEKKAGRWGKQVLKKPLKFRWALSWDAPTVIYQPGTWKRSQPNSSRLIKTVPETKPVSSTGWEKLRFLEPILTCRREQWYYQVTGTLTELYALPFPDSCLHPLLRQSQLYPVNE